MQASIIITTYNRSEILKRAISSARAQEFDDYEILVVDHASTDDTAEVMKHYPDVRYIRIEKNSGIVSTARNRGVREAKGEFIVFLDDDNELDPMFLKKTVELLAPAKDMHAICTGRILRRSDFESYAAPYRSDMFGNDKFASIDGGWLIRKSVFDEIQYDEKMFFSEDGDFGLRFTEKFAYMNTPDALHIVYTEGEHSHSSPNPKMLNAINYYLKKNLKYFKNDKNELRFLYRLVARRFYMGGRKIEGIKYFWKSFWVMKNLRTFKHFLFILCGWKVYNWYMTKEERK